MIVLTNTYTEEDNLVMGIRYTSRFGTESACRAMRTDQHLEGLWYHATDERSATLFSNGAKVFGSSGAYAKDRISFTRDPRGSARNLAGWEMNRWIVTAVIIDNPRTPRNVGLDPDGDLEGHTWVHVWHLPCIVLLLGSLRERTYSEQRQGLTDVDLAIDTSLPHPLRI